MGIIKTVDGAAKYVEWVFPVYKTTEASESPARGPIDADLTKTPAAAGTHGQA